MSSPTTKKTRELAEAQLDEQILAFRAAVTAWRAGEITDGQYADARKTYEAATAAWKNTLAAGAVSATHPTVTVTSDYAQRCQPYKVEMVCGHVESRMMRPATAGIPWTPDATIQAPYAECKACRRAKGEDC